MRKYDDSTIQSENCMEMEWLDWFQKMDLKIDLIQRVLFKFR